jgi:hypothetical protein
MTKEQILGILRHTLTTVGGVLVTRGYIDDSMLIEGAGAIVTLVGIVWSIISKRKAA